ncbi:MAG TPA: hypothetical protein VMS96_11810 [Terriglobales bacterium]|nr:hypothetical protein [Terriglobales bacterium]
MPYGTGSTPSGGTADKPTALLTIIGAACTSEKFRTLLFHDPKRVFTLYPDLKLSSDEQKAFEVLTAKREAPNHLELSFAKVHAMLIAFGMPCTWPCEWKLDPSVEMMKKQ